MPISGLLPTPTVSDHQSPGVHGTGGLDLRTALTLLPAAFPANRSAKPESGEARTTTAISGRRCYGSYASFNRHGSSVRTLVASLLGTKAWYSNKCALTWRLRAMKYNRFLFQLRPSTHRTGEIESGLLHTPRTGAQEGWGWNGSRTKKQPNLAMRISMLPTPNAKDGERGSSANYNPKSEVQNERSVVTLIGQGTGKKLRLQPAFPEWMMGFPKGWCDFPTERLSVKPGGGKKRSKPTATP